MTQREWTMIRTIFASARSHTNGINLKFYGSACRLAVTLQLVKTSEDDAMHANFLMQSVLAVLSAVFGGFGVFLAIYSVSSPSLAAYAVVSLVTAGAIAFVLDA
jgi:hypothetical protein